MQQPTWDQRRAEIEHYFDRTAVDAWRKLTSSEPVGRIRETVRAGRDRMRNTLLDWLPHDLTDKTLLDAGCGTGAFAVEAAKRGAHVIAIDLSPTLIELATERLPREIGTGRIDFRVGDMSTVATEQFDHVVAMDSLIHYESGDAITALTRIANNTRAQILFTFAPRTGALAVMHTVGKVFPKGNRSPAIQPVAPARLWSVLDESPGLSCWRRERTERISSGFYTSQACELVRV